MAQHFLLGDKKIFQNDALRNGKLFLFPKRRENSLELATNLDVARGAADGVEGVRGEDAAGDERRPEHRPGRQDRERAQGRCQPHRSSELCARGFLWGNRSRGRFRTS